MGDVITCKCILSLRPGRSELYVGPTDGKGLRVIDVRPKGTPKDPEAGRPSWEYEEKGGRLHIHPSLHCLDTGFHTAGDWDVDYVTMTEGDPYERFFELNPAFHEADKPST